MKKERIIIKEENVKPIRRIVPIIVLASILIVVFAFVNNQRKIMINHAELAINEKADHISEDVSSLIDFAENSIMLSAINVSSAMNSEVLENPSEVINPMVENSPFDAIEYIRKDGMNVMNIGEPFDASDRVYYQEGIKGNTGIWNNYHPKMAKDTLVNFYTPLYYNGEIAGVLTGYVEAKANLSSYLEDSIYGQEITGLLIDENNMVICTTLNQEYEKDYSLEMLMDQYNLSEDQKNNTLDFVNGEYEGIVSYYETHGEGRACVKNIPNTDWKIVLVVPASSFNAIIGESTKHAALAIVIICIILVLYATYVLLNNINKRKEIAIEKARLEEENRIIDEKNRKASYEISQIHDIIASANMGTWRIELMENEMPRMYADDVMKRLLGTEGIIRTPEDTYTDWFSNIKQEAVESVLNSVERMKQGYFDENTYKWNHPTKGSRYVRCGGTAEKVEGGFILKGYHYDVDEVVRKEKSHMLKLKEAIDEKREYYSTLGSLGNIFYSMHVIDLANDMTFEFNAKNEVKDIVNHNNGAKKMMEQVISSVTEDAYVEDALNFTDLTTVSERMKDKIIITREFVGKHIGWFLASFIMMEKDENGRPTKVIFATRVIDEEKKQEEQLIRKTQTDEMTGVLNRRAYEEGIYAHNDTPEEDDFIYISLDVNGLKVINDTKGHVAGDELIIGACECMKKCFDPYGNIYRVGGDEFVAILFCKDDDMDDILQNFNSTLSSWKGALIDEISVSYGWVSKREKPGVSTRELGAIAEQRMYEEKSAHYRKLGVDRRGQMDAHKALCDLYTKILKINLTEDSYSIVNMEESEQTKEKGFEAKISEWLLNFGKTGQVHPEDLDEYLKKTDINYMRDYFKADKSSLHIFYRRKYGEIFKQVMMEIIPANDYSEDNESLYLYVKSIDK